MFTRVALFLLVGTSTFATIPPCDKLDLWRQTVPLKKPGALPFFLAFP